MHLHQHRVEAAPLRRDLALQEGMVQEVNALVAELEQRIKHAERAVLASTRTIPQDLSTTYFMPAVPWTNATMLGTHVLTDRSDSRHVLLTEPEASTGIVELLRPGAFWSVLSSSAVTTVEARVRPAYTMKYNEVIIPFIGGTEQAMTLFGSASSHLFGGNRTTVVERFDRMQEWNGRISVRSHAAYKTGDQYVHVGVAPYIYQSTWMQTATVRAERTMEQAGTLRPLRTLMMPSNVAVPNALYYLNGTAFTGAIEVAVGDVFAVEAPMTGLDSCAYIAVERTLTA